MSAPYIPFYIDDFDAATAHLSLIEEAIYMRLIKMAWRTVNCTIVNDLDFVSRKIRAEKKDIEIVLNEFFVLKNGRWTQKRLKCEFDKYKNKISERKKAGKRGGISKSLNNKEKKDDFATLLPEQNLANQNQNQNHIKEKTNKKDFVRGVSFKNLNLKTIPQDWLDYAIAKGLTISQANAQFESFANYWISEGKTKKDWLATWRNRITSWIDAGKIKPQGEIPQTQIIQEISKAIQAADRGMRWNDVRYGMTLNEARLLVNPKKCEAA